MKRKKSKHEVHFGEDDFFINGFRFNSVHIIPEKSAEITETDFYMDTGEGIYLLRLRNNAENRITFYSGDIIYIVVEKILSLEIKEELRIITRILERIKIPSEIKESTVIMI